MTDTKSSYSFMVLLCVTLLASVLITPAGAVSAASGTYVKTYANVLAKTQVDVTPADVATTSDGRSIALAALLLPGVEGYGPPTQ
ncbi:MAG TPA: hypothetical protein VKX16_08880 [Chloroflexota bacterium]|nr:hypothetical protein [Chloroflexota bacterium]